MIFSLKSKKKNFFLAVNAIFFSKKKLNNVKRYKNFMKIGKSNTNYAYIVK